jgi:hypothetical protein
MREGPVTTGGLPRWVLGIVRKLNLRTPLNKRLVKKWPPPAVTPALSSGEHKELSPAGLIAKIEALEPDAAWNCYRQLSTELQGIVAVHVGPQRWAELLFREVRAHAFDCRKRQKSEAASPDGKAPIKKLSIRDVENPGSFSCLETRIDEGGDLVLDRVDGGRQLEEVTREFDYEFFWTVPAEWKDTVLLHLMKERFPKESKFAPWCKERGIPVKSFYWH